MCVPNPKKIIKAAKSGRDNQKKQLGGDLLNNIQESGGKSFKKSTGMINHNSKLKGDRVEEFAKSNKKKKRRQTLLTGVDGAVGQASIGRKSLLGE
tara:strand:+ start:17639 stop:17926 length:288 start_codon:yes stop_codon:yes gene_type:complete